MCSYCLLIGQYELETCSLDDLPLSATCKDISFARSFYSLELSLKGLTSCVCQCNLIECSPVLIILFLCSPLVYRLSFETTDCLKRREPVVRIAIHWFVLFYSFRNSTNAVAAGNSENMHRSSPGSIKQLFNRKFSNLDAGNHSNSYNNSNNNHKTSVVITELFFPRLGSVLPTAKRCHPEKCSWCISKRATLFRFNYVSIVASVIVSYKIIWFYQLSWQSKLATVKRFESWRFER